MTKCRNVGVSLQPAGGRVVSRLVPSAGPHLLLAPGITPAGDPELIPWGLCLQLHVVTGDSGSVVQCAAVCSALQCSVRVSPGYMLILQAGVSDVDTMRCQHTAQRQAADY